MNVTRPMVLTAPNGIGSACIRAPVTLLGFAAAAAVPLAFAFAFTNLPMMLRRLPSLMLCRQFASRAARAAGDDNRGAPHWVRGRVESSSRFYGGTHVEGFHRMSTLFDR